MNKQEYIDWKRHPITMGMFATLNNNISAICTELGVTAGKDSLDDRFKVGYITACRDVLDVDFAEDYIND